MIAPWLVYSVILSSLLGAAALLVEHGLIAARVNQIRWVWIAAYVGSMAAIAGVVVAPGGSGALSGGIAASAAIDGAGVARAALPGVATRGANGELDGAGGQRPEGERGFVTGAATAAGGTALDATDQARGRAAEAEASAGGASGIPAALGRGALPPLLADLSFPRWDRPLIVLWIAASLLLLARLAVSQVELARRRREWRIERLDGTEVLVSENTGPAVVGMLRGAVVIPEWAARAEPALLRAMLEHEREHLRAGDHRLLLLVATALVLFPWNLPLWWQARRLRNAVEIDCDGRVLRTGVRPREYCESLLKVAVSRSPSLLGAPGLGGSTSFFERRVRILGMRRGSKWFLNLIGSAAVATAILLLAWMFPVPASPLHASEARVAADVPSDREIPSSSSVPLLTPPAYPGSPFGNPRGGPQGPPGSTSREGLPAYGFPTPNRMGDSTMRYTRMVGNDCVAGWRLGPTSALMAAVMGATACAARTEVPDGSGLAVAPVAASDTVPPVAEFTPPERMPRPVPTAEVLDTHPPGAVSVRPEQVPQPVSTAQALDTDRRPVVSAPTEQAPQPVSPPRPVDSARPVVELAPPPQVWALPRETPPGAPPATPAPPSQGLVAPPSAAPAPTQATPASRTQAQSLPVDTSSRTVWDGVYTEAQARRGQQIAEVQCAVCHNPSGWVPLLGLWQGQSLLAPFRRTASHMPMQNPGSLQPIEYTALIAYILQLGGAPAGSTELPHSEEALGQIRVPAR